MDFLRSAFSTVRGIFTPRHPALVGSEDMLRSAASVLTKTGDAFLPAVVQEIATAFGADMVFVGEFVGHDQLHTVALWRDGTLAANEQCLRTGTPCDRLTALDAICHRAGASAVFSSDTLITSIRAEGYVAVPLVGAKGDIIGVLAALTRRPLTDERFAVPLMQLVAGRVAAELERASTERELRKNEHYLRQVQRVEAIGWLAGNIAHDFNNLLMIVIGYAEILRERGGGQELSELLAAARRASTLTKQLLAFGRRQVMQVQRVDLNHVVAQVQPMLTRVMSAQVRVITSFDPALPSVEVDPGQLEQVVVNLAINARDAMPEGGTLHIATSVVDVAQPYFQMAAGRYVRLSVRDTGVGMPPDVLSQIFEPFFTTKGSRGTGLGLSSVYGIVKQSGGYIWCDSTVGAGTTFSIYLRPVEGPAAVNDLPAPATERTRGGEERVLVVDDEPAVRKLLARILRARGYDVFETEDGPSALALMSSTDRQMDLVVSDVLMPKMSGTQLAKEIQARWPSIKILLVSGYPRGDGGRNHIDSTLPILGKPFTPTSIENAVRELLDGAPRIKPA